MKRGLARVRKAAADRAAAEVEYRSAFAAAHAAGVSVAAIAAAAGVSRQAVYQLLERTRQT